MKSSVLIKKLNVRIMIAILSLFIMILIFSVFVVRQQYINIIETNMNYYNESIEYSIKEYFVGLKNTSLQISNRSNLLIQLDEYVNKDIDKIEFITKNNENLKYSLEANDSIKSICWFDNNDELISCVGESFSNDLKMKIYENTDKILIKGPLYMEGNPYIVVLSPLKLNGKCLGTASIVYSTSSIVSGISNLTDDMIGFEQIFILNGKAYAKNDNSEELFIDRFGFTKDNEIISSNYEIFDSNDLLNIKQNNSSDKYFYFEDNIFSKQVINLDNMSSYWNVLIQFDKNKVLDNLNDYIWNLIYLIVVLIILAGVSLRFILKPIIGKLIMNETELEKTINENLNQLNKSWEIINKNRNHMIESKKQRALARLIQGLAHKINTPMGIILTSNTFSEDNILDIQRKIDSNQFKNEDFNVFIKYIAESTNLITKNTTLVIKLIDKLKYLSDDHRHERTNINLKETIDIILVGFQKEIDKYQFKVDNLCLDDIYYYGHSEDFVQIITNLVLNSMQHGKIIGKINKIVIKVHKHENQIYLEYNDNGSGITYENIDKIFDPYFTTSFGKGNGGLGLYIVENIVKNNLNGMISCSSVENMKTVFLIQFPA